MPSEPSTTARTLLDLTLSHEPTLGRGRLVCIDGPAGSGKTTLAAALADLAPEATVVHTDELLEGWGGLPGLETSLDALLRPLAAGEPGRWRRWDWHGNAWAEWREVVPGPLLVLEGVGSWAPAFADLVTTLAWVEVPRVVRTSRWLARDGDIASSRVRQWQRDEDDLHRRLQTCARASLRL